MLPEDIPKNPGRTYKKEWRGLDDWVGIALQKMDFLPFEEARDIIRKLKLKNMEEWYQYCKSGKLPDDIPQNPRKTYKNKGWDSKKGYGYWLGTNFIAHQKKKFRSFGDARGFLHILRKSTWMVSM